MTTGNATERPSRAEGTVPAADGDPVACGRPEERSEPRSTGAYRPIQVGDEILSVLDTDGEAHEAVGDTPRLALLARDGGVGHSGGGGGGGGANAQKNGAGGDADI